MQKIIMALTSDCEALEDKTIAKQQKAEQNQQFPFLEFIPL